MTLTKIAMTKRGRVALYADGAFVMSLHPDVFAASGLSAGSQIDEDALRELFFQFLRRWQQGESVEQPGLPEGEPTLPELEQYYRKLDLYFSFAKAFDCPVDED